MWIGSPKDWRPDDLIHTQPFWIAKGEKGLLPRIALFQTSHLMLMLTAPSSAYFLMHKRVAKPGVTAGCAAHQYREKPAKSLGEFHFYQHYAHFWLADLISGEDRSKREPSSWVSPKGRCSQADRHERSVLQAGSLRRLTVVCGSLLIPECQQQWVRFAGLMAGMCSTCLCQKW